MTRTATPQELSGSRTIYKPGSVILEGMPMLDGRPLTPEDLPEPVLHAKDRWISLARRIRGQFSIVAKSDTAMVAVTDMTGSFPVFVNSRGPRTEFGPTFESVSRGKPLPLDHKSAARYVAFESIGVNGSLAQGIRTLPGSTVAFSRDSDVTTAGWFDWPAVAHSDPRPFEELEEEFKSIFASWAKVFLPKDGRIGLLLSGGTDSGVIAALMKPLLGDRLVAITQDSILSRYSERSAAAETAERMKIPLLVAPLSRGRYYRSVFAMNAANQDAPIPFTEAHNGHVLASFAHEQGINTLLTGSNADCLFLGLDCYFEGLPTGTQEYLDAISKVTLQQKIDWCVGTPPALTPFSREILASLGVSIAEYESAIAESYEGRRRRMEQLAPLFDLPTLQRVDFSINGGFAWHGRQGGLPIMRAIPGCDMLCPYYDPELIKFAIAVPKTMIIREGETKFFLREVLKRATGLYRTKRAGSLSPLRYWRFAASPREYARLSPALQGLYRRQIVRNVKARGARYIELSKLSALGVWLKSHNIQVQ